MVTKKRAIEIATKQYNWKAKDVERALYGLDPKTISEQSLLEVLLQFAGPELIQRQRLQAAQKALVTRLAKRIQEIEVDFQNRIEGGEEKLEEMRSTFIPLLEKLYNLAKPFGLRDPWIEALLATYKAYCNQEEGEAA